MNIGDSDIGVVTFLETMETKIMVGTTVYEVVHTTAIMT